MSYRNILVLLAGLHIPAVSTEAQRAEKYDYTQHHYRSLRYGLFRSARRISHRWQ